MGGEEPTVKPTSIKVGFIYGGYTELTEGTNEFNKIRRYIGIVPKTGHSRTVERRLLNDPARVLSIDAVIDMINNNIVIFPKHI